MRTAILVGSVVIADAIGRGLGLPMGWIGHAGSVFIGVVISFCIVADIIDLFKSRGG